MTASEIEQAEEFNGQFTDVFNKSDHSEVPFFSRTAPFINDIIVSELFIRIVNWWHVRTTIIH